VCVCDLFVSESFHICVESESLCALIWEILALNYDFLCFFLLDRHSRHEPFQVRLGKIILHLINSAHLRKQSTA